MHKKTYFFILALIGFISLSEVLAGPYTIQGIQVQNNKDSAITAKQAALKDGRRQAFHIMLQKMIEPKEMDRFDGLEDQTIEFLIDSFQVSNEKMGTKSYKATVNFDFNKQRLEEFLRNKAIPFIVPVHKSVLVLPVLSVGAKTYLFDAENAWLDLWRKHNFNQALVTFIVANGDLSDLSVLDAEDAVIGAAHKLTTLAQRYQVSAVVVPYVSITMDGRNLNARLDFQEYDNKGVRKNNAIRSHNLTEVATEVSKEALLGKLLPIAIENIQSFCKAQLGGGQYNLIYLKVPTKTSGDYYKYIKMLNDSTMAQDIQPVELSKNFSVLRVKTLYTLDDLLKYFKERGYNFEASQEIVNPYAYEASTTR